MLLQFSKDYQNEPKDQVRKKSFYLLGNVFAVLLLTSYLAIYAICFFQLDNWKNYFFRDSLDLRENCSLATTGRPDKTPPAFTDESFKKVITPHLKDTLGERTRGKSPFYHVEYRCTGTVTNKYKNGEITNLHIGWLIGFPAKVLINGKTRIEYSGADKPVIPILLEDYRGNELDIRVQAVSDRVDYLGMIGLAPIVIAHGKKTNFRIFGVETALTNNRPLYSVIPVLTLAIVLVFGWFYGSRSRLINISLMYLFFAASDGTLNLLTDYWPWSIIKTSNLKHVFMLGSILGFVLFGMEILGLMRKYIFRLQIFVVFLVASMFTGIFFIPEQQLPWANYLRSSLGVAAPLYLIIFGRKSLGSGDLSSQLEISRRRVNLIFLCLCGFIMTVYGIEGAKTIAKELYRINFEFVFLHYMNLIVPLFVGGILLYTLSLIEKSYQDEKAMRKVYEADLALAREIQDSLAPPPENTLLGQIKITTFQRKHAQVAGDWMAVRQVLNDQVCVVVADATGKGVQAALIIHAVQSLWAEELDRHDFDPEVWMRRVNRALFKLGERRPHSLTMGMVLVGPSSLKYWSAGHLPLFVVSGDEKQKINSVNARGSILGLAPTIMIEPKVLELKTDEHVQLMLGTDGVFEDGSRTSPRKIKTMLVALLDSGIKTLDDCPANDDKTLILINRLVA